MPYMTSGNGTVNISVPAGSTLRVYSKSGTYTVTGSSVLVEDVTETQGCYAYGPQTSTSSIQIATTGALFYDVVAGDVTPDRPLAFNPTTGIPDPAGAAAVRKAVGASYVPGMVRRACFGDSNEQKIFPLVDSTRTTAAATPATFTVSGGLTTITLVSNHLAGPGHRGRINMPDSIIQGATFGGQPYQGVQFVTQQQYYDAHNVMGVAVATPAANQVTFRVDLPDGVYANGGVGNTLGFQFLSTQYANSIVDWAAWFGEYRTCVTAMYAQSGSRASFISRQLDHALASGAPAFDVCELATGTNDLLGLGISTTASQIKAAVDGVISDVAAFARRAIAAGKPVLYIIPQATSTDYPIYGNPVGALVGAAQLRLAALALQKTIPGFYCVDAYADSIDAAGRMLQSCSVSGDGIHLYDPGAAYIGRINSPRIKQILSAPESITQVALHDDVVNFPGAATSTYRNLLKNPAFTGSQAGGTGVTGTMPTDWTLDNFSTSNVLITTSTAGQAINVKSGEISNKANQGLGWRIVAAFTNASRFAIHGANIPAASFNGPGWYQIGIRLYFNTAPTGFTGIEYLLSTGGDASSPGNLLSQRSAASQAAFTLAAGDSFLFCPAPFYLSQAPSSTQVYFWIYGAAGAAIDMQASQPFVRKIDDPQSY